MENQTDKIYVEEVNSAMNCEMEIEQKKPRHRRKIAIIGAVCVIAMLVIGCIADLCGAPILRYYKGIVKLERDQYAAAQNIFDDLGDEGYWEKIVSEEDS
jgi:hypothetical protein